MDTRIAVKTAAVAAVTALFAGCAHPLAGKGASPAAAAAPAPQIAAAAPINASSAEPSVRGDALIVLPQLKAVYFDFDSARISEEARAELQGNAEWLKQNEGSRVQVAGNCDQRGTVAYNLALGQRRAEAVRSYYVSLGVAADRVATISYGKEKPVCAEAEESCWLKNRRADSLEAVRQTASNAGPADSTR